MALVKFAKNRLFFSFVIAAVVLVLGIISVTNKKIGQASACGAESLADASVTDEKFGTFEGAKVEVPTLADNPSIQPVLGVTTAERWIEVDLSEQKLRAWDGNQLFLETLVSTGLPWFATPQGEYHVWSKVRAAKMSGGSGRYYYYLPNVPFIMFFENAQVPGYRGYSLHGTYWHSDFGKVHSHGCVNLPTPVAEQLYYWTSPVMPEGKSYVRASSENPGTRIVIHE